MTEWQSLMRAFVENCVFLVNGGTGNTYMYMLPVPPYIRKTLVSHIIYVFVMRQRLSPFCFVSSTGVARGHDEENSAAAIEPRSRGGPGPAAGRQVLQVRGRPGAGDAVDRLHSPASGNPHVRRQPSSTRFAAPPPPSPPPLSLSPVPPSPSASPFIANSIILTATCSSQLAAQSRVAARTTDQDRVSQCQLHSCMTSPQAFSSFVAYSWVYRV